jgi:hypothetical protein
MMDCHLSKRTFDSPWQHTAVTFVADVGIRARVWIWRSSL